jgi:hypothetical protein
MIFGLKDDGSYVVEFKTAEGAALAISIPRSQAHTSSDIFKSGCPMGCSCRR